MGVLPPDQESRLCPFVTDIITVCYPAFSSFLFLDHNKEWIHAIENPSVDLNFVVYVRSNES